MLFSLLFSLFLEIIFSQVKISKKFLLNAFSFVLRYKLEDNGIEYKEQEESYTSKASYLDNDVIPIHKEETEEIKFSGRRIKRGIYKSKQGKIINADLNGALNILKKAKIKFIEPLEYLKYDNIFISKLV